MLFDCIKKICWFFESLRSERYGYIILFLIGDFSVFMEFFLKVSYIYLYRFYYVRGRGG